MICWKLIFVNFYTLKAEFLFRNLRNVGIFVRQENLRRMALHKEDIYLDHMFEYELYASDHEPEVCKELELHHKHALLTSLADDLEVSYICEYKHVF